MAQRQTTAVTVRSLTRGLLSAHAHAPALIAFQLGVASAAAEWRCGRCRERRGAARSALTCSRRSALHGYPTAPAHHTHVARRSTLIHAARSLAAPTSSSRWRRSERGPDQRRSVGQRETRPRPQRPTSRISRDRRSFHSLVQRGQDSRSDHSHATMRAQWGGQ